MNKYSSTRIEMSIVMDDFTNNSFVGMSGKQMHSRIIEALDFSTNIHLMEYFNENSRTRSSVIKAFISEDEEDNSVMNFEIMMLLSDIDIDGYDNHKNICQKIVMDFVSLFDMGGFTFEKSNVDFLIYGDEIDSDSERSYEIKNITRNVDYIIFRDSERYNIADYEEIEKTFDEDLNKGVSDKELSENVEQLLIKYLKNYNDEKE